jgi:MoxR-like ATPase
MSDLALLENVARTRQQLTQAIAGRVVGQHEVIDAVLTAIFAGGHALLIGVPGLAKTLLVKTIADALGWNYRRIQFTPDLMPSDILGTDILREDKLSGERRLEFIHGPIFGNIILADEINRTPPKTQAALLEAMQEYAVTVGGRTYPLPAPFFVLATQNPIEQEGTYPLPEAQLDRFLFSIYLEYPTRDDERAIAALDTRVRASVQAVLQHEDYQKMMDLVFRIPAPQPVIDYAVQLVRASRPVPAAGETALPYIKEHVAWGAGPRAAQALVAAARARAALHGLPAVTIDEIRAVAVHVLAHRIVPSFQAAGAGVDGRAIVQKLLALVVTA